MRKLTLLLVALSLMACEKELTIDYHTTNPLYVAEIMLTPEEITARITTTQDIVGTPDAKHYVDNAVVTISEEGTSWADTLENKGKGNYKLFYYAVEGHTYTVDVCISGHHYTSTSTMRSAPVVNSFGFVWQDVLTERLLFADLRLQDNPDENNYYFMHLYRNNIGYRWAVIDDSANPGGELQQLFSTATQREMEKGTNSDALQDGDRLRLEVRSIDLPTYNYFYSLQLMNNTGTNPVSNFTGGLLGYFSACQVVTLNQVFNTDSVR